MSNMVYAMTKMMSWVTNNYNAPKKDDAQCVKAGTIGRRSSLLSNVTGTARANVDIAPFNNPLPLPPLDDVVAVVAADDATLLLLPLPLELVLPAGSVIDGAAAADEVFV
jgi:hypothetical protein